MFFFIWRKRKKCGKTVYDMARKKRKVVGKKKSNIFYVSLNISVKKKLCGN